MDLNESSFVKITVDYFFDDQVVGNWGPILSALICFSVIIWCSADDHGLGYV